MSVGGRRRCELRRAAGNGQPAVDPPTVRLPIADGRPHGLPKRISFTAGPTHDRSCQSEEPHSRRHRRLGGGDRPRGPCAGGVQLEAVLGAARRLRCAGEQPGEPRRRGDAGHAACDQRGMRARRRCRTGLGLKAQINHALGRSTARTTSIRTCRRATRSASTSSPIVGEGEVIVDLSTAEPLQASASSACISSRMPASRSTTSTRRMSYVDLNRSGVALMEIVSKPDMRSADEAKAYVTKLRTILRYLGTCDGDMEKGNLRADVNVSVRKPGDAFGTRCEIKNVNSIRFIGQAIDVRGAPPDRHHRGWRHHRPGNAALRPRPRARRAPCAPRKKRTTTATSPIPTCCRSNSSQAWVDDLKPHLPELPDAKKARASSRTWPDRPMTPPCSSPSSESADYLRGGGQGPRRQERGELGHQRAVRPPEQGGPGHRRLARCRPRRSAASST